MTGRLLWVLQEATDPVGPTGWSLRNWMGLLCQVVVFILLVAFIFWLADLGERDPEAVADGPPTPPAPPAP